MKLSSLRSDLGWRLLRDGYRALPEERRRQGGADTLVMSMLGRRAVVVRGEEGTRLFYDEDVVARTGAVPPPLAWLLFGRGAVHGMDGTVHRSRKAMFLGILTDDRIDPLVTSVRIRLEERTPAWRQGAAVFDQLVEVYGGAALSWAGIRLDDAEAARISHRLSEIVGGFGFAGTAYLRGWRSRLLLERWAKRLVRETRNGSLLTRRDSPLATIAGRDELDDRTAAVELLNALRPTVAVAWPATMALSDLLRRPDREEIVANRLRAYVHECRRLQPFVPALVGKVLRPATLGDVEIGRGDRLVLDVIGTHTDPRTWSRPTDDRSEVTTFDRQHFDGGDPAPYAFAPQGAGDPAAGHRCPGEPLTVRLLETTLRTAVESGLGTSWSGRVDVTRIPALPDTAARVADAARHRSADPAPGPGRRSAVSTCQGARAVGLGQA